MRNQPFRLRYFALNNQKFDCLVVQIIVYYDNGNSGGGGGGCRGSVSLSSAAGFRRLPTESAGLQARTQPHPLVSTRFVSRFILSLTHSHSLFVEMYT